MTLPETELLQYVHKTADMGCQGLKSVLDYADGSLRSALESQLKEYQNLRTQAAGLLRARQENPGSAGALARASAEAMTFGKLMLDSSPLPHCGNDHSGLCRGRCQNSPPPPGLHRTGRPGPGPDPEAPGGGGGRRRRDEIFLMRPPFVL